MLSVIDIDEKICRVCGEVMPLASFDRRRDTRDGYAYICKACHAAEARERAEQRKAGMLEDCGLVNPGDPYIYLARTVIVFALRDWKRGKVAVRRELIQFFGSSLFDDWADIAEINPDVIRDRLGIC